VTAVNEWIVREYFESLGYLVSQPHKHVVPGRQKTPGEEVDLIVVNPRVKDHKLPDRLIISSQDLKTVARALVSVRGWHTDRFYTSTFEQAPDLLRFVEPEPLRFAARRLGSSAMAKILCLPKLPASGDLKDKTIVALKKKGIDGILTFRTMLAELVGAVDTRRNYEKSDLLQIIRLLKNYDLVKDSQLELFGKRKRGPKPKA
jgi:hypothetical protein